MFTERSLFDSRRISHCSSEDIRYSKGQFTHAQLNFVSSVEQKRRFVATVVLNIIHNLDKYEQRRL